MAKYSVSVRPSILSLGDTVTFSVGGEDIETTVKATRRHGQLYLDHTNGNRDNQSVFSAMNVHDENITAMAQTAYGYRPTGDRFPRANPGDYRGLTTLTNTLLCLAAPASGAPAPAPAPGCPVIVGATPILPSAPVTVTSGKYSVTISLTDAGITIVIN